MAPGTSSPIDGTRNIYFPTDSSQGAVLFKQSSFIYREPRNIIDLTLGMSTILRNNFVSSSAISVPLTGGNARAVEFITTLNKYF
jgi:hypothetical protein